MKTLRKVFMMFILTFAIVAFWLAPGINKAEDTAYVRRYEDTDATKFVVPSDTTGKDRSFKTSTGKYNKRPAKVYKEEKLSSRTRLKDVKASMYSRAIQFEEVSLPDSLQIVSAARDSVKVIP